MWPRPSSDRLPQQPTWLKPHTWDYLIGGIYKNFRGMQRELINRIASRAEGVFIKNLEACKRELINRIASRAAS